MTNREWLNSLPNEEFANYMISTCKCCAYDKEDKCLLDIGLKCNIGLVKWLKQKHR